MKKTVGKFLKLYEPPFFPFRSLSDRAFDLGLTEVTSVTGEQFLTANHVSNSFWKIEKTLTKSRLGLHFRLKLSKPAQESTMVKIWAISMVWRLWSVWLSKALCLLRVEIGKSLPDS